MSAGPSIYSADSSLFHSFSSFSSFSKYSLHLSETCSSDTRSSPLSPYKQLVPIIPCLSFFFCLAILKMFCLPSLEFNNSACFFITSACTLAIHLLASFLDALYSACFISFSYSSAFFHSLNFCLLVSTAFSTSSHHHQVSLYLYLPFVIPQAVVATSVIAFSTLSHCSSTLTLSSISIFLSCNFSKYAFLTSCFFSFHTLILGYTLCKPWWFFLYFLTFKCMSITTRWWPWTNSSPGITFVFMILFLCSLFIRIMSTAVLFPPDSCR